jgi:hypothetical protein
MGEIAEEFSDILFRAIVEARADLVSQVPGARHITDSGHYIHQEQPQLVNQGQCFKAEYHAR